MELRLFRDPEGYPRAEVAPPHEVVGWWLEQDVQRDAQTCDSLLDSITAVRSGREPRWEGTGNAHTLIITPAGARIESEFAEPPAAADLTLDELQDVLTRWKGLVSDAPRR